MKKILQRKVKYRVEINVEDSDTEIVTGPLILEAESKQALDQQVKFTLSGTSERWML
jgi:hypothetical protein